MSDEKPSHNITDKRLKPYEQIVRAEVHADKHGVPQKPTKSSDEVITLADEDSSKVSDGFRHTSIQRRNIIKGIRPSNMTKPAQGQTSENNIQADVTKNKRLLCWIGINQI